MIKSVFEGGYEYRWHQIPGIGDPTPSDSGWEVVNCMSITQAVATELKNQIAPSVSKRIGSDNVNQLDTYSGLQLYRRSVVAKLDPEDSVFDHADGKEYRLFPLGSWPQPQWNAGKWNRIQTFDCPAEVATKLFGQMDVPLYIIGWRPIEAPPVVSHGHEYQLGSPDSPVQGDGWQVILRQNCPPEVQKEFNQRMLKSVDPLTMAFCRPVSRKDAVATGPVVWEVSLRGNQIKVYRNSDTEFCYFVVPDGGTCGDSWGSAGYFVTPEEAIKDAKQIIGFKERLAREEALGGRESPLSSPALPDRGLAYSFPPPKIRVASVVAFEQMPSQVISNHWASDILDRGPQSAYLILGTDGRIWKGFHLQDGTWEWKVEVEELPGEVAG